MVMGAAAYFYITVVSKSSMGEGGSDNYKYHNISCKLLGTGCIDFSSNRVNFCTDNLCIPLLVY